MYDLIIFDYMLPVVNCYVFFFQAEDGIRDGRVTGVQTCALPIWNTAATAASAASESNIRPYAVAYSVMPWRASSSASAALSPKAAMRCTTSASGRTRFGATTEPGMDVNCPPMGSRTRPHVAAAAAHQV